MCHLSILFATVIRTRRGRFGKTKLTISGSVDAYYRANLNADNSATNGV